MRLRLRSLRSRVVHIVPLGNGWYYYVYMPKYDFLSNDFSHPHHRRSVAVLILSVVVFGLLIVAYLYSTDTEVQKNVSSVSEDRATAQSEVVSQLNASAPVLVSNGDKKKIIQRMSRPSSGLTDAQKTDIINQLQTP